MKEQARQGADHRGGLDISHAVEPNELGTEIIVLTLHYRFNRATIVADSAIECYETRLPHTYVLCSFALFFYPFLIPFTLDSH